MQNSLTVDLFVEDNAHEKLLTSLLDRIAQDLGFRTRLRVVSARGGAGRALSELQLFRRGLERGLRSKPDLIVVCVDGNCKGHVERRSEIQNALGDELKEITVVACPDPHIERWFMIDPEAFHRVLGCQPKIVQQKCKRDIYKNALVASIRQSGNEVLLGGIEYAADLAAEIDFYSAGKRDPSFAAFYTAIRAWLQTRSAHTENLDKVL